MREHALGGPSPPRLTGKAAALDRLRRAGLPVPPGLVIPLGEPLGEDTRGRLRELLRGGPVIVRSALAFEDQATTSGAGLGTSIHGCTSEVQIDRALETIGADRRALAARGESPVCSRAAIVGSPGLDETPLYRAVLQVSAGPGGATIASESARDVCHGLLAADAGRATASPIDERTPENTPERRADLAAEREVAGEAKRGTGPERDSLRDPLGDQAIVQREIAAALLLVIADAPDLATTVEVYRPGAGALSGGSAPSFAGPLGRWPNAARSATEAIVAAVRDVLMPSAQGLDLEIVVDGDARPWLVQARPLTRALQPGWSRFAAAVDAEGASIPDGWWRLDTEHNPAPLSAAHDSLLTWLRALRPATPRTFAGWLYDRVPPPTEVPSPPRPGTEATADDVDDPQSSATGVPSGLTLSDPYKGVEHLQTRAIPAAREQLRAITEALATADRGACAAMIDRALGALLRVIDTYAALAPYRAGPRSEPPSYDEGERAGEGPRSTSPRVSTPLCLADRGRFLDVLPCAWDIAAPSLSEIDSRGDATANAPSREPIDDPAERSALDPGHGHPTGSTADDPSAMTWLLRELDDHLFALGLAPMRRLYLRAAQLLQIDPSQVFGLRHGEVGDALCGGLHPDAVDDLLVRRAQAHRRSLALRPPPHIFNGAPLPIPAYGHLRGLGIGTPYSGPVAQRQDLADLKARPPEEGAILIMPTLTVSAAVVLDDLGVRALCSASGGALSHAALIVRELGISALIGCRGATDLTDGERIVLDTARGRIQRPVDAAPSLAHSRNAEQSDAGG